MKRYILLAIEKETYDKLSEWCNSQRINLVREELCLTGKKMMQYFGMEGYTSDYLKLKAAFPGVIEIEVIKLENVLDCHSKIRQSLCEISKIRKEVFEAKQLAESRFKELYNRISSVEGLEET